MASKRFSNKSRQENTSGPSAVSVALGSAPTIQDFGIAVDEKEVKKQCRKIIAEALKQRVEILQFQPLPDSTQGFEGLYCSDSLVMGELSEAKKSTPLTKWFEKSETTYWIGFRLGFLKVPNSSGRYINTISLMIARSFSGSQTEAVLRAEWAYYADAERAKSSEKPEHAQPHWHIYKSNLNQQNAELDLAIFQGNSLESDIPIVEFNSNNLTPPSSISPSAENKDIISNFHFAMCAHWNRDQPIIQWPISEQELIHWLRHCLTYIRSELESVKS